MSLLNIKHLQSEMSSFRAIQKTGKIISVVGNLLEVSAITVEIGGMAEIDGCLCEVIGARKGVALLMALDPLPRVQLGATVVFLNRQVSLPVGDTLIGRVLDPLGRPKDGKGTIESVEYRPLDGSAPNPMLRSRIDRNVETGVRVIDGLLSLGEGQRIAIMAGSGVGKSTLMGMLARNSNADVNVIALVGERGREVREFIENDLQEEGMKKSVVVVSTSDVTPALQIKGMQSATAIAEYFRDQGKSVLLMTDSITRLAMAQRQLGLAAGEPPTTKGYPPSVFTLLPRVLERAGCGESVDGQKGGSITSVSTVLIEGDDINDPIGDTVRSIVDGHIVLSRRLVGYGHYPPVDVLQSLSRTMPMTVTAQHMSDALSIRKMLAVYDENEELIRLGAYKRGSDRLVDLSMSLKSEIDAILQQDKSETESMQSVVQRMRGLAEKITSRQGKRRK